jgi:23S rRNA (cytosine1962-C5)-methyltransferase
MISDQNLNLPSIESGEDKSSPFVNRLRKNYRHLRKWAKRTHTNCFRIYDREVPNYPVAIDIYGCKFCVHDFSRKDESEEQDVVFINEIEQALTKTFGVSPEQIFWKTRAKTKVTRQYEKLNTAEQFFSVLEYGVKFRINLEDYLDTGLFLDHRETRQLVAKACKGKSLLNLFAYTCSFSVHAAVQGAISTKSVDMSNTYTDWGKENFILNNIPLSAHTIIREDCLKFLVQAQQKKERFGVIVIDPPTISRSKKMEAFFDIQIDYLNLIKYSLKLLDNSGIIFFSTNSRKFKFDLEALPECTIKEISNKTLPMDYHDPKIHRCWMITLSHGLAHAEKP